MAFTELELQQCNEALERFLEKRCPPVLLRDQVDLAFTISDQSVELVEIRAYWRDPTQKTKTPLAKATFVRTKSCWEVFWIRSNRKWNRYEPNAEVETLEAFLAVVDRDVNGCFFG